MNCAIQPCDRPVMVKSRRLCSLHYGRDRRYGDAAWTPMTREERFWQKVEPDGICWLWTGGLTGAGYGVFGWRENGRVRNVLAHRYAYEALVGPIRAGFQLDHLCRRPHCVNPDHLEPVTARTNTLRGVGPSAKNARATHCKNGHAFTAENTWVDEKRNTRHCRTCSRRRFREWNARRKAVAA